MSQIKATMHEKNMHGDIAKYPDVVVLLRIEELLARLCRKLDA
jgi:hypothetical protein